mgnify:CR=1 FL=1
MCHAIQWQMQMLANLPYVFLLICKALSYSFTGKYDERICVGIVVSNDESTDAIWRVVREYAVKAGIPLSDRLAPHALRATAATNALENEADIAKVQQFLGHANISTTRIYDRRDMRPADSPVWRIKYL